MLRLKTLQRSQDILRSLLLFLKISLFLRQINGKIKIPYLIKALYSKKPVWLFIPKLVFNDDIKAISSKYLDVNFVSLKRGPLVALTKCIIGDNLSIYNYISNSEKIINRKKRLYKIYWLFIFLLKRVINLQGIISGAYYYVEQRELAKAALDNGIEFVVLHKECITSPIEILVRNYIFRERTGPFTGSVLLTYNQDELNNLKDNSVVPSKCITRVTGAPRIDELFKLNNFSERSIDVSFFWFGKYTYLPEHFFKGEDMWGKLKDLKLYNSIRWDWSNLQTSYLKAIIKYANINPNLNIVLKSKVGFEMSDHDINEIKDLKNIRLVKQGTAQSLLKNSKVVIAFNSTVIFEALAAHCYVGTLSFEEADKSKESGRLGTLDLNRSIEELKSVEEMYKFCDRFSSVQEENKLTIDGEKLLDQYLGNKDGLSSIRLRTVLQGLLK
ncbi:MAG: hypothetical protein JJ848_003620 [Prochlorococcus marinus CUG1439]|uniref:hypothetical protein n=1 Tax=Prochlorococcus sp. MIT 1314 TaxID=3096220 RepID=UPI001B195880|nr:hypothetical protein [Prochlorococcus sp. MIT 1314]MCR8539425.1 hypothetical protein [Prochlorococcus marinus CUG1439]